MFGYVKPVVKELLVKEHEFYKATYCGICRMMKKYTGALSPVTITYDSVFLALVRMAFIDDSELSGSMCRCVAHPLKKRRIIDENPALVYTARAFAILTYYKTADDISDEKLVRRLAVGAARPVVKGARKRSELERLDSIAKEKLSAISALEAEKCKSVDLPATLFGELLGEIFSDGLDGEGRLICYQVGYRLGRFVYVADAAEDYEEDARLGRYNPFVLSYGTDKLSDEARSTIRTGLLLECRELEAAVNLLPFGRKHTVEGIVKNIIYLGLTERIGFLDPEGTDEPDEKG
jgi:hypothetical protein